MINRTDNLTPRKTCFRVLVIDEHEAGHEETLASLGKSWPFDRELQVFHARNLDEALDIVAAERCAVILLNEHQSAPAGMETLRRLRNHGVRIPAVMVSSYQRDDILDTLEELAAAHVHKDDLNMLTLYNAIATSLQRLGFIPRSARAA